MKKIDLIKYLVGPEDTIEESWKKIEENHKRSVIVVDNNIVVGSLSDGDIRKAILSRRIISTPIKEIMNVNFFSLTENNKEKAEKIFKEKNIFIIPIVDEKMHLRDLIFQ